LGEEWPNDSNYTVSFIFSVNITRMGAENDYMTNLESKALVNSLAEDVGYAKIFTNASLPSVPPSDEVFGFELDQHLFQLSEDPNVQNDISEEHSEELEATNENNEDNILDEQNI